MIDAYARPEEMSMNGFFQSTVVVPDTTLVRELPDGESVLLSLSSERYFNLDRVGTSMWAAVTSAGSIDEACRELLSEFDVAENRLRDDLRTLVEQLAAQDLVEIKPA
jgi:hypothetical protein